MNHTAHHDPQAVIEESHSALAEFIKGNPQPITTLFSHCDDVCLGNPFGPFVRGWEAVKATADRAATLYRDGEVIGFQTVSSYLAGGLACYVETERYRARMGGRSEFSVVELRVTTVLRQEDGAWKIVHRHADPITTRRPADSVIQNPS